MLWIAGPALYAIVCGALVLRHVHSFELLELVARYALLGPALWWAWRKRQGGREDWVAPPWWAVAIPFGLAAAMLSYSFANGITAADENSYIFQARIFATGHLFAEAPPGAAANPIDTPRELYFENQIVTPRGWTTKYYPGWPAALMPFAAVHLEWMLNPLLAMALFGCTHALARRWFDWRTARVAVLAMALSPYLMARSIGFMSDLFCAVLVAAAWMLLGIGVDRKSWASFAGMFGLLAIALMTRPFTTFAVAVVMGIALIALLRREPRRLMAVLCLGAAFAGAGYLGMWEYNKAVTGDGRVSPYAMARGLKHVEEVSLNPRVIWTTIRYETRWSLQGTFVNTFPFLFVLAGVAAWRRRADGHAVVLALLFPVMAALQALQSANSGGANGGRYYLSAFFAVAILAAALIVDLRPGRWMAISMVAVQAMAMALSIPAIYELAKPFMRVHDLTASLPLSNSVIYLQSTPEFTAFHDNLNAVDWRHAPAVYLVDPGPERRAGVMREFGRSHYAVVTYDGGSGMARVVEAK